MRVLTGLCAVLALCANASAGEIDFSFNSDAVRVFYLHDFINSELTGDVGFTSNSDKGKVLNLSLYRKGLASDGVNPLQAGVGIRSGYVDGDRRNQSGIPFAVGAFMRYTVPTMDRLSIRGDAWYAPDVLTTGDLDTYEDFQLRLQYAFLREADIFVGVRYLNAEFSNGTRQIIDNGLNLGFNIRF